MKIIWLGHGSFRIETSNLVLLIDPWLTGNPVLPEDQHEAAVADGTHLILTHAHFDPYSKQPSYKDCAVRVRPLANHDPLP